MKPIALYGGTFDPVHQGHLLVAQAALEELGAERVVFIPAARSPFKPDQETTPAPLRLAMLRLALAGRPRCELDDQEIRRGGVSFTIETVRHWTRGAPAARLCWLIGADHVASLPQWREAGALAELAEFVVIPRPGRNAPALPAPFRGRELAGFPFGVSASQLRARVGQGLPVDWLTPPAVAEFIRNNGLYL